jgi:hypothetical protein
LTVSFNSSQLPSCLEHPAAASSRAIGATRVAKNWPGACNDLQLQAGTNDGNRQRKIAGSAKDGARPMASHRYRLAELAGNSKLSSAPSGFCNVRHEPGSRWYPLQSVSISRAAVLWAVATDSIVVSVTRTARNCRRTVAVLEIVPPVKLPQRRNPRNLSDSNLGPMHNVNITTTDLPTVCYILSSTFDYPDKLLTL